MDVNDLRQCLHELTAPSQPVDDKVEANEKFLRALLHVIAGIIAALTIIVAAVIQALSTSAAGTTASSRIYTIVFSELLLWLSVTILLSTISAFIVQILRYRNRNNKRKCRFAELSSLVIVILIFIPSLVITSVACCGSAYLFTAAKLNATEISGVANTIPCKLQWVCTVKNWLPLFPPT